MDKSTGDITKRKRPEAAGEPVLVRLQPDLLAPLDDFVLLSKSRGRPEAIRLLLKDIFHVMKRR